MLTLLLAIAAIEYADMLKIDNPLMCANVKPLRNITLKEFEGNWVLQSVFEFSEGIPAPSESERSEECNWYLYGNATSLSMDEYSELRVPDHWLEDPEAYYSHLYIKEGEPGHWIFNTSRNADEISSELDDDGEVDDMLIVLADPQMFIVVVSCPPRKVAVPEHERFVKLVSILSRRDGRNGTVLVDQEKLTELEQWSASVLNFTVVPHIQQRTDC